MGALLREAVVAGCALAALASGPAWAGVRPTVAALAEPSQLSRSDLEVVRMDPSAAAPGELTTVHAFVANGGPERTSSSFTVVVTLPEGTVPQVPFFPENCEVFQLGYRVRCTFPAGLAPGRSATALVPVRLAQDLPAPGTLAGWAAVRGADDSNDSNDSQPFVIPVMPHRPG
ncbi:hypothetical protein [Streptomyces goshikiensis]|uniref:hypothetical protein n=1 Tax=Streptomyces goshikiensis TaxID=1942 RepID=UPI0036C77ED4